MKHYGPWGGSDCPFYFRTAYPGLFLWKIFFNCGPVLIGENGEVKGKTRTVIAGDFMGALRAKDTVFVTYPHEENPLVASELTSPAQLSRDKSRSEGIIF